MVGDSIRPRAEDYGGSKRGQGRASWYSHAEEDVVLRAEAQTLSDGAELGPDVFAHDVGRAGGRREQTRQDRPTGEGVLASAASLNHSHIQPFITFQAHTSVVRLVTGHYQY